MKRMSLPARPAVFVVLSLLAAALLVLLCGAKAPRPSDDEIDTIARNTLRTVVSAEFAYYARNGSYASLLELAGSNT